MQGGDSLASTTSQSDSLGDAPTLRYLSLFSGIGGFELGLIRSKLAENYRLESVGFSEIDKHANQVYLDRFPDHPALGDVCKIDGKSLGRVDLFFGGSPCQNLSSAGCTSSVRTGLEGPKSGLFYEYLRLLKETNPTFFVLENVGSMKNEHRAQITELLKEVFPEVCCTALNAKDFGPQRRKRYFWTNFPVEPVTERRPNALSLPQILLPKNKVNRDWEHSARLMKLLDGIKGTKTRRQQKMYNDSTSLVSSPCLAMWHRSRGCFQPYAILIDRRITRGPKDPEDILHRNFAPEECERLQGFVSGWTESIPAPQRIKCCGNAVCVPVVKHVFDCLAKHLLSADQPTADE
jgi:DNA-cytosine methyltransferase